MTSDTSRPSARETLPAANEQNPALVRALKIAVIGMGILILAGLAAVVWRIVHLSSSPKDVPPAPALSQPAAARGAAAVLTPEMILELPEGAAVRAVTLSANRLAVHYEAPGGAGIAIVDLETGRTLTRIRLGVTRP